MSMVQSLETEYGKKDLACVTHTGSWDGEVGLDYLGGPTIARRVLIRSRQ